MESLKNHKEFIRNDKSILKTKQRFECEKHNVFTEVINKVTLILNDDKRMQSIDLIKTSAYGTSKDLVREKVEIKSINLIKQYKINFDDVTKVNIKEHNPNSSQISHHPYRILITGGSKTGKTNFII